MKHIVVQIDSVIASEMAFKVLTVGSTENWNHVGEFDTFQEAHMHMLWMQGASTATLSSGVVIQAHRPKYTNKSPTTFKQYPQNMRTLKSRKK